MPVIILYDWKIVYPVILIHAFKHIQTLLENCSNVNSCNVSNRNVKIFIPSFLDGRDQEN